MRPLAFLIAFVSCLVLAAPARAANDITQLTCGELLAMSEEDIGIVVVWIDGYYSGQHGETTFDPDSWENLGKLMGTMCGKNPKRKVTQALDEVIGAVQGN